MMKEPKLNEANYTKLYKDVDSEVLSTINTMLNESFQPNPYNKTMSQVFTAKYRFYEICDIDEEVFLRCVQDVYDEYINYYTELFVNYKKTYDYSVGNKRTMVRHDESHSEREGTTNTTGGSTKRDYDLPNKTVDSTSENGYLTGKSVGDMTETVGDEGSKDSTYDSTITNTYDNEFLDLKKKYLAQIRNLYEEFAERFSDCFLHLFS